MQVYIYQEVIPMRCTKFAFAGFRHGHIFALYNALTKREDVCIVGAFEADAQARAEAEAKGVVFTYDSLEQLLADPQVDVVAIGDYFGARGGVAIRALRAGKHVLSDKPICTSLQELETIRAEAEARNLAVGVMLDMRSNPKIYTALNAVQKGMIGKISNVCFEGQHPLMYGQRPGWYYEEGKHGGVINDIAIHGIDILRLMGCGKVARVVGARSWNFYAYNDPQFEDCTQFILEMENGAGVIGDVSYSCPDVQLYGLPTYWHFRVWGDQGMLDFGYNIPEVTLYAKGESKGRALEIIQPEADYLELFLQALACPALRGQHNAENILTSQQTLLVQQAADNF